MLAPSGWTRHVDRLCSDNDVSIGPADWLLDDVALLSVDMMRREVGVLAARLALPDLLGADELELNVESFSLEDTGRALVLLARGQIRGRPVVVPVGQG